MESLIKYLEIDEIPDEEREHVKVPDTLQVNGMVEEFLKLTRRKKVADKKLKELKPFLLEYLEANATPDAKGTMKLQLPAGKLEGIMRETIRLDDERAIEHCQNQGFDSCFEEVTLLQLKESEFEKKVKDGSITAEELRSLVDVKKSLALYVKELV